MKQSLFYPPLVLTLIAVVAVSLLLVLDELTTDKRRSEARAALARTLQEVSPVAVSPAYDWAGSLYESGDPTHNVRQVYPVRRDGELLGMVVEITAAEGYNGMIHLLAGLDAASVISRLRVVSHRETPGLGDRIEAQKSDWIEGFIGLSADADASAWKLKKQNGDFDDLTGATITAAAILNGVSRALSRLKQRPPSFENDTTR